MARTLDQKIAEAQLKLAGLKEKARSADTRQKIVVGAAVTAQALQSESLARELLAILAAEPMRDHDRAAVSGLIAKLQSLTQHKDVHDAA